MPRRKSLSRKELIRKLMKHDSRFVVYTKRGRGSEKLIYHPNVNGRAESYPLPGHGEGAEIRKGHLPAIRRRFDLPADFFD